MQNARRVVSVFLMALLLLSAAVPSINVMSYAEEAAQEEVDFSFASKRLIVKTDNSDALKDEPVIANLDNVYILQYESEDSAKASYVKLLNICDAVEVDGVISVAEDEPTGESSEMTEEENPFVQLEESIKETTKETFDVAVIDTGANEAEKIVSVVGDDGLDNHGHGQKMIDIIKKTAPDAKVLSIKALGDNGTGDISSVYAAIKLAIESDVKVINLSISALKTEDSFIIEEAIKEAVSKGITVVGAAGNNGLDARLTVPGSVEEAIIVGTTGDASNTGDTVDYIVNEKSTSYAAAVVTGLILADTLKDYKIVDKVIQINENAEYPDWMPDELRKSFKIADGAGGGTGSGTPYPGEYKSIGYHSYLYYDNGGWNDSDQPGVGNDTYQWQISYGEQVTDEQTWWWLKKMTEFLREDSRFESVYNHLTGEYQAIEYGPKSTADSEEDWDKRFNALKKALQEACDAAFDDDTNAATNGKKARVVGVAWEWVQPGDKSRTWQHQWLIGNEPGQADEFDDLFSGEPGPTNGNKWGLNDSVGWSFQVDKNNDNNYDDVNGDGVVNGLDTWRSYAYNRAKETAEYEGVQSDYHVYAIAVLDDEPKEVNGSLALTKTSANPSITNGNACYSLDGAVYELFKDAACTEYVIDENGYYLAFRTDANGKGWKAYWDTAAREYKYWSSGSDCPDYIDVPEGRYYYKEIVAPKGYARTPFNPNTDYIDVSPENTVEVPALIEVSETPNMDPIGILLKKVDKETGEKVGHVE